ncbi:hypothetical protein CCACVL1_10786, partial [Corchorus capsularis]
HQKGASHFSSCSILVPPCSKTIANPDPFSSRDKNWKCGIAGPLEIIFGDDCFFWIQTPLLYDSPFKGLPTYDADKMCPRSLDVIPL